MRRSMFCDKCTMPIPNWHARTRDAHDCCSMYGAWLVVIALTLRYWWYAFCFDHRQACNRKLGWLLARWFGKLGHEIWHLCGRRHTGSFCHLDIGMSTSSSGICFVARARASNTNDSFGIQSISKQTLDGQKQIDESGLLAWQTFGQRSKDKNRFVMN